MESEKGSSRRTQCTQFTTPSEHSPRSEQQQQQQQQQQEQHQQQQQQQDVCSMVPMESAYAPAKRLPQFMPLNMQQVQKSMMEKQALASGTSPTGGLAQRQHTFSESHASTRLTLSIRASSGLSVKHRAAFLGLPEENDWPRDESDSDSVPAFHRGKSAPDLEAEASRAESVADSCFADEVDLAMLPRRHSRMIQQLSVRRKPKNRLEEIMKEMMLANHANDIVDPHAHGQAAAVKSAIRPNSYTTAHLSGVTLCSTALSAIARAERMLVKLHDKSAISLELDSRPASRAQDHHPNMKPAEGMRKHVSIAARAGPSATACNITNQVHAKAKLWGNASSRPDSPSIAKASHAPSGSAIASFFGERRPSWRVGMSHMLPTKDMRARSMIKRHLSMEKSASRASRDGGAIRGGVMQVMGMLLADEELNLVGAARRRLQMMEKSLFSKDCDSGNPADDSCQHADAAGEDGTQVHIESSELTAVSDHQVPTSRDGDMFSGVFGRMSDIRKKLKQETTAIIKNNPAAFQEDVAAQAEAEYRAMSERAHHKYEHAVTRLMEPRLVEDFKKAIKQLQSERPYFLPPIFVRDRVERAAVQSGLSRKEQPRWLVDQSVFRQRKKEGEARDLFDHDQVTIKQFNMDWQRVAAKVRFRRLVEREDKGVQADGQRLEEELAEVRQEVFKFRNQLRSMFVYYSCKSAAPMASEFLLNMGLGDWMCFCNEADIVDNSKRGCSISDLQMVFIAVNFEEEPNTLESDANDDDAMMRFEFYEGIVRAAFGRFITTGAMTDASDATQRFIADTILPRMCKEALIDPNEFRRERLYTEQMSILVEDYWDLMFAMYKMFKAKDRTKFFWIEHWATLLESTQLLGPATGLERREAKMIFVWSQMLVTDELRRRKRAVGLMFFDFVEALARVAEFLSPPSMAELFPSKPEDEGQVQRSPSKGPDVHPLTEYFRQRVEKKMPAPSLVAAATSPLHVKFESLMDYLTFQLRAAWGGKDRADCAAKMMHLCMLLGSGIELG